MTREGAHLGGDGVDVSSTTGRVDGVPQGGLAAEDGGLRQAERVGLPRLPFNVSDHDFTGAWGTESLGRHGRVEEKEGEVGVSVSGRVGGDDRGDALGLDLAGRDHVDDTLGKGRRAGRDGDVKVLRGKRRRGETADNGKVGKHGVVGNARSRGRGRRGAGGRVGLFSRDDLVDTVLLVGRVDGANSALERVDDVKDVVQLAYLRVVVVL